MEERASAEKSGKVGPTTGDQTRAKCWQEKWALVLPPLGTKHSKMLANPRALSYEVRWDCGCKKWFVNPGALYKCKALPR